MFVLKKNIKIFFYIFLNDFDLNKFFYIYISNKKTFYSLNFLP